jgi:tRNA-specific 2-thiouridylase
VKKIYNSEKYKKKVAMLISGGVDSSVATYLLLQKGYKVIGVTLKLWSCDSLTDIQKQLCCSPKDIYDAKTVCAQLGVQHYVLDFSKEFNDYIVENFCKKYISGFTPNPCVWCNNKIKFGIVFDKLKNLFNIDFLATGHYAKIVVSDGKYFISKAKDENKDQSYFLCNIPKEVLPYILFPLGDLTKEEVRKIAAISDLKVANKKESFDICFIPDGNYGKFIISKGISIQQNGKIVDYHTKKFLGYHKGYFYYTIGQRKNLGIKSAKSRMYVVKIEPQTNTVYVSTEKDLYSIELLIQNPILYEDLTKLNFLELFCKIRYRFLPVRCKIEKVDKDKIKLLFEQKVKAVTKGQYAVVYDKGGRIVLSGEIVE